MSYALSLIFMPCFPTGEDRANREVFKAENIEDMDFVGIAIQGAKKSVDKVLKGLALHK